MLNLSLPRMYFADNINNFFKKIVSNEDKKLKTELTIFGVSGSFPYMYWNGKFNNNKGNGIFREQLQSLSGKGLGFPLHLDCSNVLLTQEDYYDTFGNIILELFQTGSELIEISNINFLNYINNKYPYYKFILSEYYYLQGQNYTTEILNNEHIKYFKCSLENKELIDIIPNKTKIIASINYKCFTCPNYSDCNISLQLAQYNYSEKDVSRDCLILQNYKCPSLDDLKVIQKETGISHFAIEDSFKNNQDYFYFLLDYLIKPEYQKDILEKWDKNN